MFDPKQFVVTRPKPVLVCLLLDVSYSMQGQKIDLLNQAVGQMLEAFADEQKREVEILVSVITFGEQVNLHLPFRPANEAVEHWQPLSANGMTPMGVALKMAKAMIEDKQTTPSRAYRPTVVLVSDGQPNDEWQQPLTDFIEQGRSAKCDRMAMAIGNDADEGVLRKFLRGSTHRLFQAEQAADILTFFNKVTMSVTQMAHSHHSEKSPTVGKDSGIMKIDDSEDDAFL